MTSAGGSVQTLSPGEALLVERRRQGLSQAELARRSGFSQSYLSFLEREQRTGSDAVWRTLAGELGVPVGNLVRGLS